MPISTTATPSRSDPNRSGPVLVGISGWARSGKDSLAASLVGRHGYQRLAFADRVKALAGRLCPEIAARAALDGWEVAKADPEVRNLLQKVGVTIRDVLGHLPQQPVRLVGAVAAPLLAAGRGVHELSVVRVVEVFVEFEVGRLAAYCASEGQGFLW